MSNNRYIVDWTQIGQHGPVSGIRIIRDAGEAYELAVDVASGLATDGGTWSVALLEISGEERATLATWDHTTHGVNMWGELFEYSDGPLPSLGSKTAIVRDWAEANGILHVDQSPMAPMDPAEYRGLPTLN